MIYKHERSLFKISCVLAGLFWLLLTIGTFGILLIYLLFGYLFFLFAHSAFITHLKGNGVRITAEQYPDLYASLERNSKKIGLDTVPEAYLLRTDFFNALATRFRGRNFLVLFSDVVDALEQQPTAIDFYIGHELGHLHRKHLQWAVFLLPALFFPLLGPAYRRAQEYTCDRYGAYCCNSDADAVAAMAAISAGDTRWKSLNLEAYLKQVNETGEFWMSFNEINSDYPWLTKRMAAVLAFRQEQTVSFPKRHKFAWFLSLFIPRSGAGAVVSFMLLFMIIGMLAAVAIPAYQQYIDEAEYAEWQREEALELAEIKLELEPAYQQALLLMPKVLEYPNTHSEIWPKTLEEIGHSADEFTDPSGNERYTIDIYDRGMVAIEVWLDGEGEHYIVLEPSYNDELEKFEWECYGQDIDSALLNAECL